MEKMMILPPTSPIGLGSGSAQPDERARLILQTAQRLEASFLSEMLAHAGFDGTEGPFSGGPGAEHFKSFLREVHAQKLVERGGIGLAHNLVVALAARAEGRDAHE
jgi:peptidoglycan hydrolase FlgJ